MEHITRTIYGAAVMDALFLGKPHTWLENTTLNEKFAIQAGIYPASTQTPTLKLLTIGIGGHDFITGAGGRKKVDPVQHYATDAALFDHIPFVLRLPEVDLTPVQRARYALRKLIVVEGVTYVAYYAKRLDLTNTTVGLFIRTVREGVSEITNFVPNASNLNPTKPDLSPTGVNLLTGTFGIASALVEANFERFDIDEILNACAILFEDPGQANISELGLCTAVDKMVSVSGVGGSTFNFNEAIGVQLSAVVQSFYPMEFINENIEETLELGIEEPLFKLTNASA